MYVMGSTPTTTTPLFGQPSVYNRNVDVLRRLAVGGVLQIKRAAEGWSVEQAAVHAGIGHMTWRRIEDGYAVRNKTYASVDQLLGLSIGAVKRALGDDLLVAALARDVAGEDISEVTPQTAPDWVERFAKSTLSTAAKATIGARTSVALHPARATAAAPAVNLSGMGSLTVGGQPRPESPDVVLAAELLDRFTRRTLTPSMERAMRALLDAMPDLLRPQGDGDAEPHHDDDDTRMAMCQ